MEKSVQKAIHPMGILKESFLVWWKNLVAVVAIYSITVFLARLLQLSKGMTGSSGASGTNLSLSILFIVELVAVLIANSFLVLVIIYYFKAAKEKRPSFSSVFEEARRSIISYLKPYFLLLAFVTVVSLTAFLVFVAGDSFYKGPGAFSIIKLAVLVATDTVFVVLVLAGAWYGFFFTLAPLIGGLEKKGAWLSFRESRARIRGNALRYLAIVAAFIVFYVVVGLLGYFVLTHFSHSRFLLRKLDPAMGALFGPLWLAVWYFSYEKLTASKVV